MNKNLNLKEQYEITGGAKLGVIAAIVGVGTFIIGIIDGLIRPIKCYRGK